MKKKYPVVLRPVNNAKAKPTAAKSAPSRRGGKGTTCAQHEDNLQTSYCPPAIDQISAACHPSALARLGVYLADPPPADAEMLNAWERVGREDAKRGGAPRWRPAGNQTLTALGLACLVRYARGFEDEAQAVAVRAAAELERSSLAPDDESRRQRRD